jgi:hypothetical protein
MSDSRQGYERFTSLKAAKPDTLPALPQTDGAATPLRSVEAAAPVCRIPCYRSGRAMSHLQGGDDESATQYRSENGGHQNAPTIVSRDKEMAYELAH